MPRPTQATVTDTPLAQHRPDERATRRAKRRAHTEFAPSLRHGVGQRALETDRREDEGEPRRQPRLGTRHPEFHQTKKNSISAEISRSAIH